MGWFSALAEQPAIVACIHSDEAWRFPNRSERDYDFDIIYRPPPV